MRLLLGLALAMALGGSRSASAQVGSTAEAQSACASAAFANAEVAGRWFDAFRIVVPFSAAPGRDLIDRVVGQIEYGSHAAQSAAAGYEAVIQCGSPTWTVAALVRQGQMYARLAWAVRDQANQYPQFPPELGQRIATAMDPQVAPIDCLAIVRYVRALRSARAASLRTQYTEIALDALRAYEVERVTACVADQSRRDAAFASFTPRDLAPL